MSLDSDTVRFIREEIRKQVNVILMGKTGETTFESEDIQEMFADMPTITKRPTLQPFGLASSAPKGTRSVVGRLGEHFGARIVLGHRDQDKPTYFKQGETVLYNEFGQQIYLESGKIHIGAKGADQPLVLGTVFAKWAKDLIAQLVAETHTGNLGYLTSPPTNAADYQALSTSPIEDKAILSDESFTQKGGG